MFYTCYKVGSAFARCFSGVGMDGNYFALRFCLGSGFGLRLSGLLCFGVLRLNWCGLVIGIDLSYLGLGVHACCLVLLLQVLVL